MTHTQLLILCVKQITNEHRELYSVLCSDLNGKEIQKRGDTGVCVCVCVYIDTYIYISDSLCCMIETSTTL